jgi:hypothetical protein
MPNALNTAAMRGISTCRAPARRAAPHTVIGPAPPNAASTVSPVTVLASARAAAIAAAWTSSICRSASSSGMPSGPAILSSITLTLRSGCRASVPPR